MNGTGQRLVPWLLYWFESIDGKSTWTNSNVLLLQFDSLIERTNAKLSLNFNLWTVRSFAQRRYMDTATTNDIKFKPKSCNLKNWSFGWLSNFITTFNQLNVVYWNWLNEKLVSSDNFRKQSITCGKKNNNYMSYRTENTVVKSGPYIKIYFSYQRRKLKCSWFLDVTVDLLKYNFILFTPSDIKKKLYEIKNLINTNLRAQESMGYFRIKMSKNRTLYTKNWPQPLLLLLSEFSNEQATTTNW